jgi:putative Ca2+/H+ antiporter (TMEM165/GDT1 family)
VAAGHLLSRLPQRPVALVAAALFAIGAGVLLRGARRADAAEAEQEREYATKITDGRSGRRAAATSFAVLFTAEWGDLSQLLTAGLVASGQPAVPVFIGAWLALVAVSGAAVLLGRWLLGHVRLSVVRYVAAAVCASLALITLIDVIRAETVRGRRHRRPMPLRRPAQLPGRLCALAPVGRPPTAHIVRSIPCLGSSSTSCSSLRFSIPRARPSRTRCPG